MLAGSLSARTARRRGGALWERARGGGATGRGAGAQADELQMFEALMLVCEQRGCMEMTLRAP